MIKARTFGIDLRPYFIEATETLGLVRTDAVDWIISQAHTEEGHSRGARTIRCSSGEWRFTLTPDGLRDPENSFDDTFYLAMGKANRARRIEQEAGMLERNMANGRFFPAALLTIAPVPVGYCAAGETMAGKLLDRHPQLPWPGCDQRVCRWSWRLITRKELDQLLQCGSVEDHRSAD